jgi:mannan endo-1,4-beta-mannosidase
MNSKIFAAVAAVAITIPVGAWTTTGRGSGTLDSSPGVSANAIYRCAPMSRHDHYVGLSVPGFPPDTSKLTALEQKFRMQPTAVSMYIPLGIKLNMSAVTAICAQGALPILEIDSSDISFRSITAGSYDGILDSYAQALKAMNYPVAVNFDHEFNSTSSPWGPTKHGSKDFINMWRHIVALFRTVGANDVFWIWNPATYTKGTVPVQPWYPGDAYVTWVGLDGYFTTPHSTFLTVFRPTLSDIKTFTSRPVFIDETGANPASQRVRAIDSLFSGVERTPSIKGLVWFDYNKVAGRDWQIEDDPAALAEFRAGARSYSKG